MPMQGSENGSIKRYTCSYCTYNTDRRDLYTRHEYIHRSVKPFHCYVCWKPFNRADHVKKHYLRMHPEQEYDHTKIRAAPPTGEINDGDCDNGAKIQQVVINNSTENDGQQNGKCDDKGDSKDTSTGGLERRYTCPFCLWSGVDNWCLKRHMNTHTRPYACSLCDYRAARTERLASHVLKVHNKNQCSRCAFTGDNMIALQLHRLHQHGVTISKTSAFLNQPLPFLTNQPEQPIDYSSSMEVQPPADPPAFPASSLASPPREQSPNSVLSYSSSIEARPPADPPAFPAPSSVSPLRELSPNSILSRSQLEAMNLPQHFANWWNNRAGLQRTNPYQLTCGSSRRKQTMPRKVLLE